MNKKSTKDILQAPRGMRDFFDMEFTKRKNFFSCAEAIAESHGFTGIETPIMEHTEIFTKGVGEGTDIVDKEMYNLETSGGDRLTLRPEGTAGVMRAYIQHGMGSMSQPRMMYYRGPFFRHEKPQKGRYRQLYQFGLEIMGSKNSLYDVLAIQTGYTILQKTGKNIIVGINTLGSNTERKEYILKLQNFYKENINQVAESDQWRIESNPLRILDSKEERTMQLNESAPKLYDSLTAESQEYFQSVLAELKNLDIEYEIIPELVRGLDYYEHTVFEFITRDKEGNNSHALGGGGRYDGLAESIGHNKPIPSVGLGIGADRAIEVSGNAFETDTTKIPLILADQATLTSALSIVQKYTKSLFLYPMLQKLQKQIARLEKESYTKLFILGENEVENNTILYKNLATREQKEINLDDLSDFIENRN